MISAIPYMYDSQLPSKLNDYYSTLRVRCWCTRRVQKQACYTHGCFQVTLLYYYYYYYYFYFVSSIFLWGAHCQYLLFNSFLLCCFPRWVKRDSYLPVGSQNLKATTKVGIYRYFVRAVVKSWGPGISPGYYKCDPLLLSSENRGKKKDQKKSLAVWFPFYLLYLPGNLKS